jgi:hypothetical protein
MLYVLVDKCGQCATARVGNRACNHSTITFQQSHDNGLTDTATSARAILSLLAVHLALRTTHKGFVNLDFARELANGIVPQRHADSMEHEPRSLLVTPRARASSQEEIPFLALQIIQKAGSHLSRPRGLSSKIVPTFTEG